MSTNPKSRAWVEVRGRALRENYARIVSAVGPDVHVMPMVKANAYGLGVLEAVNRLEPLEPWGFGVATVDEGVELREAGVTRPIVLTSPSPPETLSEAVEYGLQPSVSSRSALVALSGAARRADRVVAFHVDVDTGMGRSGFDWRTAAEWLPDVGRDTEYLRWAGVFTHLHSADEADASVQAQCERLDAVLEHAEGPLDGILVHLLNSAGALRAPRRARALVRPGLFLYGGAVGDDLPAPMPVVSVRARVAHVRDAVPGTTVGYGATHTAPDHRRWATLAIGYGDGLPRALGNRGDALVAGRRVPIVGRISMDVTVVDITGVPGIEEGDVATLVGNDGDETITLEEVASLAGTNGYEILTGLTARLPRVWSDREAVAAEASPASEVS